MIQQIARSPNSTLVLFGWIEALLVYLFIFYLFIIFEIEIEVSCSKYTINL